MHTRLATVSAQEGHADDPHDALRLWMRLYSCATMIERAIGRRLRQRYSTSLARFDLLAQLERTASGLRMSELSRRLMVTGGNVTGLVAQLVKERMVERTVASEDRRAYVVSLTPRGREAFLEMAAEHERWVVELTSGMSAAQHARLRELLGALKTSVRSRELRDGRGARARVADPERTAAFDELGPVAT